VTGGQCKTVGSGLPRTFSYNIFMQKYRPNDKLEEKTRPGIFLTQSLIGISMWSKDKKKGPSAAKLQSKLFKNQKTATDYTDEHGYSGMNTDMAVNLGLIIKHFNKNKKTVTGHPSLLSYSTEV